VPDHWPGETANAAKISPLWLKFVVARSTGILNLEIPDTRHAALAPPTETCWNQARLFESWLRALNQARNLCAHHARIWNRVFGLRPQIPRANKHPQWHQPVAIRDDRIFGLLSVLRYLLRQAAPASAWSERLKAVLAAYPDIPLADMGFPGGWVRAAIWKAHDLGGLKSAWC
jgi:hypothetical protein